MRAIGQVDPQMAEYEAFVMSLASRLAWSTEEREDLGQEGRLALLRALPRVDESKGKAGVYLYACIRGAMLQHIRDYGHAIRVPAYQQERGLRPPEVVSLDAMLDGGEQRPELGGDGLADQVVDRVDWEAAVRGARLPTRQQRALELRMSGYGMAEIASRLGYAGFNSAKYAVLRAIQRIRRWRRFKDHLEASNDICAR